MEVLDLAKGHPDPSLLPRQVLADACTVGASEMREGTIDGLRYGSAPTGSSVFLQELADFVKRQCPGEKVPRAGDGMLVTNGVSHGLELAAGVFARRGEAVLVESPSYFLAMGIFESHGLEVVPVATDAEGMLVDAIEGILDARAAGSPPVRLIYTIPTGHNPTGCVLSAPRRRRLVDIARRRSLLILADEVYHMLDWHPPGSRPPRMVCFDDAYADVSGGVRVEVMQKDSCTKVEEPSLPAPVVVSVNSFTKILAPGLRIGWIEAAPELVNQLAKRGYLVSGGCVASFATEVVLKHALRSRSVDAALRVLVSTFRDRARRLASALIEVGLPPLVEAKGGYFVWVPLGVDAQAVLEIAKSRFAVAFMPGARCDASGDSELAQNARLCFAWLQDEQLEEGARRLAAAVKAAKESAFEPASKRSRKLELDL